MEKYDAVIIGAGPAGLTAALYAVRSGMKTAIISKDIGGTANYILMLENWPGFYGSGNELMKKFYEQLKKYNVDFVMAEVKNVERKGKEFDIKTEKKEIVAKTIIIATGTERKKLNIPGEKELTGKGISYCTTCDAFFFKNKTAGVIGGSDCAAVSALALSDIAKKVYVLYRGEKLRCEDINSKRLEKKKNVEIFYNAVPKKILGEEKVTHLEFDDGKKKQIKLDGVFIEIGAIPITKFIKNLNLKLDKENYIIVNEKMGTNIEGVFAAGDVTNTKLKQVVIASAEGAIAAKSAYEYLRKN